MHIFVDSSFIIANSRKEDESYERAVELNNSVSQNRVISDLILSETLTYIKFHDTPEKARELGQKLTSLDGTIILLPTLNDILYAIEAVGKYKKLSFCDAMTVAQMKNNGIMQILSFDADFDLIPGIERIH